ncbi:MAG: hypothetical protein IK152_02405 [Lachnospiraceae bacterium]|nr:hypothetical protein [Lachnospiraceae bacterium]
MTISDISTKYNITAASFNARIADETSDNENDFKSMFLAQKQQLGEKILSGDTTPKFSIGAQEYSNDEWNTLMRRIDIAIDSDDNSSIIDYLKGNDRNCPYSALAKDGIIEYNGVFFTCDYDNNTICLGSMAEGEDIITVNLPSGGTLKINADNVDQISRCAGMFTPEDLDAILRAIHEHEHTKNKEFQVKDEISAALLG